MKGRLSNITKKKKKKGGQKNKGTYQQASALLLHAHAAGRAPVANGPCGGGDAGTAVIAGEGGLVLCPKKHLLVLVFPSG